jgi:hypothetical protein
MRRSLVEILLLTYRAYEKSAIRSEERIRQNQDGE